MNFCEGAVLLGRVLSAESETKLVYFGQPMETVVFDPEFISGDVPPRQSPRNSLNHCWRHQVRECLS